MVQTRAAERIESGLTLLQDTTAASPPKKPCQDAPAVTKRRRGKPGELCQLNLDVLFLLAAYVHPLDLLNLARTCRSLRELLMDRASTFVWKAARGQTKGLPDCPPDLTEPEYANLVFYSRCHGCGRQAKKILWSLRRRYCPDCRHARLRSLDTCPDFIRYGRVVPQEYLVMDGRNVLWVDQEQLSSVIDGYDRASDKEQFLKDKEKQRRAVCLHARKGKEWERDRALDRKYDLDYRRQERYNSIFERLEKHGYRREIEYFGCYEIQQAHKSFFKTSKLLTDKEWNSMLPAWLETMNNLRYTRMKETVYDPRRSWFTSAHDNYVASQSPGTSVFELLPHVSEVPRFAPFRDLIEAPEEVKVDLCSFELAFEQFPALVAEWKKQLDVEFAKLVEIPSDLSSDVASGGLGVAPSSITPEPANKLRLACAVFNSYPEVIAQYPEVLSGVRMHSKVESDDKLSLEERFGVRFLKDAAYIVHACGLDPNVATVEDMDRRDARLRCMQCLPPTIMTWRHAVRHVAYCHLVWGFGPSTQSCWQLVSEEHIDAIEAAEQLFKSYSCPYRTRCLLCPLRVGNAALSKETERHLICIHDLKMDEVRQGVHYKGLQIDSEESRPVLEMVEEGGVIMAFRLPRSN